MLPLLTRLCVDRVAPAQVTISAPPGAHAVLDAGASAVELRRVLTVAASARAVLRRVTLTGGYSEEWGGGARVEADATLLLEASHVRGCAAAVSTTMDFILGGGVFNTGTLALIDSTVEGNAAISRGQRWQRAGGGGVANGGTLNLNRSRLVNNTATSTVGQAQGGGLDNGESGVAALLESAVEGNAATSTSSGNVIGGGVTNMGTLTLTRSRLVNNTGTSAEGQTQGGCVENDGTLALIESAVEGNAATSSSTGNVVGGGVSNGGTLTLNVSAIARNIAASAEGRARGGGLFHQRGRVLLTRSLLEGNAVRSPVNPTGAQLENTGAFDSLVYVLPAPLGHWLGGTLQCQFLECVSGECANQPCDWRSLQGEWLANVPVSLFDDATFPLACQRGYYGDSDAPDDQRTSTCSARCADPFATTVREGAASRDECVCVADYFADAAGACARCEIAGINCTERVGTTLATLELTRNHWRLSANTTDVIACTSDAAADAPTPCRGGANASDYCFEGLRGPLCHVCVEAAQYYDAATARCVDCDATGGAAVAGEAAILMGVVLGVGLLRWVWLQRRQQTSASSPWARRLVALIEHAMRIAPQLGLIGKSKIVIGYSQVMVIAPIAFDVSMPTQYFEWMRSLSWMSLDWLSFHVDAACVGGFRARLLVDTLRPMTLLALLIIGAALYSVICSGRCLAPAKQQEGGDARPSCKEAAMAGVLRVLPLMLAVLFALVPTVASRIFSSFSCAVFGYDDATGATRAFLAADYAIECYTDEHGSLRGLAGGLIVLWPIGVPVLFAWLLYVARHSGKASAALPSAIRFLHCEYKDAHRYWELVELGRKLLLNGFVFLVPLEHALLRLLLAIIVSICHTVLLQQAQPYKQASTAFTAVATSYLLSFSLILFLLLSMYNELEEEQIMDFFGFESVLPLAGIIFGINMSVLLVALALFVYQLRVESHKYASRRLRHRDGTAVDAPPLADGESYHLFLSHVWNTGQDQMRIVKQRLLEMVAGLRVFLDVDDLEEIGNLERYIDDSRAVLVFCSKGYAQSKNCMVELRAAVVRAKPLIALLETEDKHGGVTRDQMCEQLTRGCKSAAAQQSLTDAETKELVHLQRRPSVSAERLTDLLARFDASEDVWMSAEASYKKWGLPWPSIGAHHGDPTPQELEAALFKNAVIEWNRIGPMQDVTMRLIAEQTAVIEDDLGTTYVQGELIRVASVLHPLTHGLKHHLYCSPYNEGAEDLAREVASERKLTALSYSTDVGALPQCEAMLIYLTARTWTSGEMSASFAREVEAAMRSGKRLVLAHEMPGIGQAGRHAVDFGSFFHADQTPSTLWSVGGVGIYDTVAVPLKGGRWRETSMALLAKAIASGRDERGADSFWPASLSEGKCGLACIGRAASSGAAAVSALCDRCSRHCAPKQRSLASEDRFSVPSEQERATSEREDSGTELQ